MERIYAVLILLANVMLKSTYNCVWSCYMRINNKDWYQDTSCNTTFAISLAATNDTKTETRHRPNIQHDDFLVANRVAPCRARHIKHHGVSILVVKFTDLKQNLIDNSDTCPNLFTAYLCGDRYQPVTWPLNPWTPAQLCPSPAMESFVLICFFK